MPWVKIGTAVKLLNVHVNSLRRWADAGLIKSIRTPGGMRLYDVESFARDQTTPEEDSHPDRITPVKIAYCRVSSAKQKDDLQRQVDYMRERCPGYEIVTDVGSGINFKRRGLRSLLERALNGELREVCVSHRDRLCRFGFDLIEWLLERQRVRLVVLDQENTSPQQEFTEDLLAIVHVFSCRFNGLRRYAKATQEAVEDTQTQDEQREDAACGEPHAQDSDAVDEVAEEDDVRLDGSGEVHLQQESRSGEKRKVSVRSKLTQGPLRHRKRPKPAPSAHGAPVEAGESPQ